MRPHRFPCSDPDCDYCAGVAEARAEDDSPDFDEDAAQDQYDRSVGL